MSGKKTKTIEERFWAKVNKNTSSSCWEWIGGKYTSGYGSFSVDGKSERAHRVSAKLAGMNINEGVVCHTCDNPLCVNPDHLFIGSQKDNMIDKKSKGRSAQKGIRYLSDDEVREIRQMSDIKQKDIAEKYNVRSGIIADIQHNRTYRDVL